MILYVCETYPGNRAGLHFITDNELYTGTEMAEFQRHAHSGSIQPRSSG